MGQFRQLCAWRGGRCSLSGRLHRFPALWEAAISACEPEVMPAISRHAEMVRYLRPVTLIRAARDWSWRLPALAGSPPDGALQLGGGGDLNVRIGGEVNPSREAQATQTYSSSGFDGLYSGGTIHDLQGPSSICAVPRACTVVRWEASILATNSTAGPRRSAQQGCVQPDAG